MTRRDVVCRLHRYPLKEQILRAAWEAGETDFDGAPIKILPHLWAQHCQIRMVELSCKLHYKKVGQGLSVAIPTVPSPTTNKLCYSFFFFFFMLIYM